VQTVAGKRQRPLSAAVDRFEEETSMKAITALLLLVASATVHAMSPDEARHLLLRTGFGATDAQLQALEALPYEQAVDKLVAAAAQHTKADTPPPDWIDESLPRFRKLKDAPPEEKKAYVQDAIRKGFELQGWWMREMVDTPTPLAEQMTLFWHNHFTSSFQKVKVPVLLYRQNVTLRRYALGNFRDMLHAIAHDPAMIVFLDNVSNRDSHPNENFARELMELFTLGIGHYGEDDVKEAARAFTGWALDRNTGNFRKVHFWHDRGKKTFLGQTGRFDGDDILDIILAQPQTATFIVDKLWRAYVSPDPDPQQTQALAAQFHRDYEIAPLMAALLKTPQFRAAANAGTLTKSPVDLVAGTLRTFGVTLDDGRFPALVCARLGQALFNPPNVKGWPGGDAWINSQTLVARHQFLESLSRGFNIGGDARMAVMRAAEKADANQDNVKGGGMRARLAAQVMRSAQALDMEHYLGAFSQQHSPTQAQSVLLAIPPVIPPATPTTTDVDPAEQLRALLLDPAYQLK
jgi:uncharacterized protein (DUF1800 family)